MLTAVCSSKGAPGATSAALALAAEWGREVVLVEADESGSSLAFRLRTSQGQTLKPTPTLASLAAVADREPSLVRRTAQTVSELVSVVPGVATPEAGGSMAGLWEDLAGALAASEVDVIVDVGRVQSSSRAMAVVEAADAVVAMTRADPHDVLHVQHRLTQFKFTLGATRTDRIVPVVVAARRDAKTAAAEIDEVLHAEGLDVAPAAYLAWDPTVLERLHQGVQVARWMQRTELLRSARAAVRQLQALATVEVSA